MLDIKFSIIMPVYNSEVYLDEAINSIKNQTYKNWELIIVNDGSKDKSGIICDTYAKKDKRIKVFHQKNKGVSSARNKALNEISGEYVGFIDSDDWVDLNWLEIIYLNIKKYNNIDLLVNGWIYEEKYTKKLVKFDECKMDNKEFKDYYIVSYNENKFPGFCCNKIYRRDILQDIRFDENFSIVEDEIYNYEVYMKAQNILLIKDSPYHYRRTENNTLTGIAQLELKKDMYKNSKQFYEIIISFYQKWGIEKEKYIYDIRKKYISSMYDAIVNSIKYEKNLSNKIFQIKIIVNDLYFKDALNEKCKIKKENKALMVMCLVGSLKNKYIGYLIITIFLKLNSLKTQLRGEI